MVENNLGKPLDYDRDIKYDWLILLSLLFGVIAVLITYHEFFKFTLKKLNPNLHLEENKWRCGYVGNLWFKFIDHTKETHANILEAKRKIYPDKDLPVPCLKTPE